MKKSKFIPFLFAIILILSACSNKLQPADIAIKPDTTKSINPFNWVHSVHITLGVPFDRDTSDDFIIIRNQYVISYNKNTNLCNWVAWELNGDWFGSTSRYGGNFITDTSLPEYFYRVKHSDYTNSGYDRGHMVMSEERTQTAEDNKATFLLTNIIPQTPDLNRGVWLRFENYCNDLCRNDDKELFVVSGPIFHSTATLNDAGIVPIPDSCFKIVVVLDRGQSLKDVTSSTQVIAVVMPNIAGVLKHPWEDYQTTVDRIEYSTGYDFLNLIPKSVQDIIENN